MAKSALSAKFLEEIRAHLIEERERIVKELTQYTRKESSDDAINEVTADEGESAERIAQMGDDLSVEDELSKAYKDIESALTALDRGEYGVCKYCKQTIDEARLKIRPTSTSCVACKRTLTKEL